MFDKNTDLDTINKVYQNAHVALQSISNVIEDVDDPALKSEMQNEYDGYEKIIGEISGYMTRTGYEPKDISGMKKAMLWSGIKMNTVMDDSKSHIAQLMVKGTVMGITELCQLVSESEGQIADETREFIDRLKTLEEGYEEKLKLYL